MGGLPSTGPMQAVSGSRGSQTLNLRYILQNADTIRQLDPTSPMIPDLPKTDTMPRIAIQGGGTLNIQNMVRRESNIPLQFIYEAADCRLWYTPEMITDYTVSRTGGIERLCRPSLIQWFQILWTKAAAAIWDDPSLCVQGSTNQSTAAPNVTSLDAPDSSSTSGTSTSSSAPSGTAAAPSVTSSQSVAVAGTVAQGAFVAFVALLASAVGFW